MDSNEGDILGALDLFRPKSGVGDYNCCVDMSFDVGGRVMRLRKSFRNPDTMMLTFDDMCVASPNPGFLKSLLFLLHHDPSFQVCLTKYDGIVEIEFHGFNDNNSIARHIHNIIMMVYGVGSDYELNISVPKKGFEIKC
jgi:hypothetical protein